MEWSHRLPNATLTTRLDGRINGRTKRAGPSVPTTVARPEFVTAMDVLTAACRPPSPSPSSEDDGLLVDAGEVRPGKGANVLGTSSGRIYSLPPRLRARSREAGRPGRPRRLDG